MNFPFFALKISAFIVLHLVLQIKNSKNCFFFFGCNFFFLIFLLDLILDEEKLKNY